MYWKYFLGFLIGSLIQGGIIAISEFFGIYNLNASFAFGQIIIHILTGQAVGFILMVIMQSINGIGNMKFCVLGSIYGAIVWVILLSINSAQGTINSPWSQGISTIIVSLLSFIVYGIIAVYSIKKVARH